MNILYYSWQENSTADFLYTIQSLGHTVTAYTHELTHYFSDEFANTLSTELKLNSYDFVFTFNFIPTISDILEPHGIPYVSWVYDCPHYTLYSTSIRNSCNYIFLFDRNMWNAAVQNHAGHAFHLPLAVASERLTTYLGLPTDGSGIAPDSYHHDISFVGSLYESTHYDRLKYAPNHLRGYLSGIIAAQKQIWGADIISEVLTPERVEEISSVLPYSSKEVAYLTPQEAFSCIIQKQITSEERIEAINRLSSRHPVALYSASDVSLCPNAIPKGTISYTSEMPTVFHRSKINLNITLRSITSGIPLRAIDIMGCGGFLLSNYQPELCEYFTPDIDFVYFEDMKDLEEKATYYLCHDKEREAIAHHGYLTASKYFSYQAQLSKMLDILQEEL